MFKAIAILAGSFLMLLIPREIAGWVFETVGWIVSKFFKSYINSVQDNLKHLGVKNRKNGVKNFYKNLSFCTMDILTFPFLTKSKILKIVRTKGEHLLKEALKKKGAIFVTPHLGNWELGGAYLGLTGYPIFAVAETIQPKRSFFPKFISWIFRKYRERVKIKQVPLENPLQVARELKKNKLIVLLGDRDITGFGKKFSFLGTQWRVPLGPATLSLKMDVPVFTGYIVREKSCYLGIVEGPVSREGLGKDKKSIEELTRRILLKMEKYILSYPDQWFVFEKLTDR